MTYYDDVILWRGERERERERGRERRERREGESKTERGRETITQCTRQCTYTSTVAVTIFTYSHVRLHVHLAYLTIAAVHNDDITIITLRPHGTRYSLVQRRTAVTKCSPAFFTYMDERRYTDIIK